MADPDHDPILDQIIRESLIEHNQSLDEVARQEQQDLEWAIALSLGQDQPQVIDDLAQQLPQLPLPQLPPQANDAPTVPNPRKQLEQERLARVAKRSAQNESSLDLEGPPSKRHKVPAEQPVPLRSLPQAQTLGTLKSTVVPPKDTRPSSSKLATPKYLEGTLKLTHVDKFHGDYVKFADLIDKQNLEKATLSAYVVDKEWLFSQLPSDKNICLIMHGLPTGAQLMNQCRIIVRPPMGNGNIGCFHAKLMLLYFGGFVRVVIGSANLMAYDWKELENIVFVQDFPRRTSGRLESAEKLPTFAKEIYDVLTMMGVPKSVNNALLDFEFSNAKVHIVASVSGSFEGPGSKGYKKYGFARLGEIVKAIGAAADWDTGPTLECQTASLGGLNTPWLANFYRAACGVDPVVETGGSSAGRASGKVKSDAARSNSKASSQPSALPPMTVVYPSKMTVQDSLLGEGGAGTICFSKNSYYKNTFPREILRDCISRRPGVLMHSKMILARLRTPHILGNGMDDLVASAKAIHVDDDPSTADGEQSSRVNDIKKSEVDELPEKSKQKTKKLVGWFYCGSHNFTQSAWGRFTISRDTKQPKINMNNWELGVVMPLIEDELDDEKIREGKGVSSQSETEENWYAVRGIPVPFERPPPEYAEDDEPWMQEGFY